MTIIIKNKETLLYDDFKFKCCIGKNGTTSNKIEGDKKTPKGIFSLGLVFYRKDRIKNLVTKLRKKEIECFLESARLEPEKIENTEDSSAKKNDQEQITEG